jgi:hypothetical protein
MPPLTKRWPTRERELPVSVDTLHPRPAISHLTTADVAERLAVDVECVLALIAAGTLTAIDVRRPGSKRPRWRITAEALADFETARTNRPTPPPARRQRRPQHVTTYF